ncbi:atp synthase subunit epsilon [Quercus suber]|uniref:ATP synthase subunit epsilon, mitochondrial n=1 Tax=Quercus suber TaxID=58331 RepID=A0AAW0M0U7_QUESU
MASTSAVSFWRASGMTYITYSNICANLVRKCLKKPHKSEALEREKVYFSISKWTDGKPQKPKQVFQVFDFGVNMYISTLRRIKPSVRTHQKTDFWIGFYCRGSLALAPTFRFHQLKQKSQHPKNVNHNPVNKVDKDEH